MKEEERGVQQPPKRTWNTTDELRNVEEIIQSGVVPVETAYEVDDIISEFADPLALTPERQEIHIERMEQRLRREQEAVQPEEQPREAPVDPEETARFVQEQVSSAIQEQEEPQEKEGFFARLLRRKPKEEQTEPETGERPEAGDSGGEEEKIIALPEDPLLPVKQRIRAIQDRANSFADNMFPNERPDEQTRLEEQNLPGTDQEDKSAPKPKPKRIKAREAAPDLRAEVLAKRYHTGLEGLGRRTVAVFVVAAVLVLLAAAAELGWPGASLLTGQPKVLAGLLTWGLALAAVLGLDVLWLGLSAPARGCTGLHTMTAAAVIVTLVDGLMYLFPGREGPMPLAGIAALGLGCAMWGAYDRKRALYISCRTVSSVAEPYRVTLDENKWDGNPAFDKEAGTVQGFGSQIQGTDGATELCRVAVPVLLVLAVIAAGASAALGGGPGMMVWRLSVILTAGAPLGSLLCYGQPLLRVTRRLDRYGAVLAGWDGAESMMGKASILIKDEDLFPEGSVSIAEARYFGDASEERVVACVASMLRKANCTLAKPFEDQLKLQGGFLRQVEHLEWNDAGGLTAVVRGHQVLIGTDGCLSVLRISIESRVRPALYCVIDGQVQGMFKLQYAPSHYVLPALRGLLRAGVELVLATRDFNVTPGMLERLDIPAEEMEYPITSRRKELSEPGQAHNGILGALLLREGLGAYSDAIIGGRRLCEVTRVNTVLALVASLLGMALTAYLTSQLAFASLSVVNVLAFMVLWLVPNLAITGFSDKF